MSVKGKAIRNICIYVAIFVVGQILAALPQQFPFHQLSAMYYVVASGGFYYAVDRHISEAYLRRMLLALSTMIMVWFVLRAASSLTFISNDDMQRLFWYSYFVPMCFIPLFMWGAAQYVGKRNRKGLPRGWVVCKLITAFFALMYLTNDRHQLCFKYRSEYENWRFDVSYGVFFHLSMAWMAILSVAFLALLYRESSTAVSKSLFGWTLLPLILEGTWVVLCWFHMTPHLAGRPVGQLPEVVCIGSACFVTCCVDIGLLPSNTEYLELFSRSRISAQIVDMEGKQVYASVYAEPLTKEQLEEEKDVWLDEKYRLCHRDISGGAIYWKEHVGSVKHTQGKDGTKNA